MRQDKILRIAHEPLAQRYLRVCWENRDTRLNCTRCGKCVRTRIMLAAHGALAAFPTLGDPAALPSDIDGLSPAGQRSHWHTYRWALEQGVPHDVAAALRRLLARSRRHEWARRLQRLVQRH